MEETLGCAQDIEILSSDINTFLQGGPSANVTLSDGTVTESYQKYVISDLTRTGNDVQARTYFVDDIITFNYNTYICIKDCVITNRNNPPLSTEWKKLGNFDEVSGIGFDAYLSYDLQSHRILSSGNIDSVSFSWVDSDLINVKLSKPVPEGLNKLGVIFSVDVSTSPTNPADLFTGNIQNTGGNNQSYIGTQTSNTRYDSGGVLPIANMMPVAKVISNSGNNYTIKVIQGIKFFQNSTTIRPPYTQPYSLPSYSYLNPEARGQFRPIVNLLFFILN